MWKNWDVLLMNGVLFSRCRNEWGGGCVCGIDEKLRKVELLEGCGFGSCIFVI
jgi:hypothetical protein